MKAIDLLRNEHTTLTNQKKSLLKLLASKIKEENVEEIHKYADMLYNTQQKIYLIQKWIEFLKNAIIV